MRALLVGALLALGCTATEVDVTVHLPGIESGALPSSGVLRLQVDGENDYARQWVLTGSTGTERFIYRAGRSSGTLGFHLEYQTLGEQRSVACGLGTVALKSMRFVTLTVEMQDESCTDFNRGADLGVSPPPDGAPACILCDNFESGTLAKWATDQVNPPGTISADSNVHHTGAWSAHFHTAPGGNDPKGEIYTGATDGKQVMWVRAWYFTPSPLLNGANFQTFVRWYSSDFLRGLTLGYDNHGAVGMTELASANAKDANDVYTHDAWTCVEWMIDLRQPGGHADVYVNSDTGAPSATLNFADSLPLGVLSFGLESSVDADLWIDDVYVAKSRIGCSTPTP